MSIYFSFDPATLRLVVELITGAIEELEGARPEQI
jgi:hypothetical protein